MMFHERLLPERWQCTTNTFLVISLFITLIFIISSINLIKAGEFKAAIGFFSAAILIILYMSRVVAFKFFHHLINDVPQEQQNLDEEMAMHMQLLADMGIRDHPLVQQVIRELGYIPGSPPATQGHDQNVVEMVPMAVQR